MNSVHPSSKPEAIGTAEVSHDSCSIDTSELLSENSCERESEIDIEEETKMEMNNHGPNCCRNLTDVMP